MEFFSVLSLLLGDFDFFLGIFDLNFEFLPMIIVFVSSFIFGIVSIKFMLKISDENGNEVSIWQDEQFKQLLWHLE